MTTYFYDPRARIMLARDEATGEIYQLENVAGGVRL